MLENPVPQPLKMQTKELSHTSHEATQHYTNLHDTTQDCITCILTHMPTSSSTHLHTLTQMHMHLLIHMYPHKNKK